MNYQAVSPTTCFCTPSITDVCREHASPLAERSKDLETCHLLIPMPPPTSRVRREGTQIQDAPISQLDIWCSQTLLKRHWTSVPYSQTDVSDKVLELRICKEDPIRRELGIHLGKVSSG